MFFSTISMIEKGWRNVTNLLHLDRYFFQLHIKEDHDNQSVKPKPLGDDNSHLAHLNQQLFWNQVQYAMNVNESFRIQQLER